MQVTFIRKRGGGYRKIYIPSKEEKKILRELLTVIPDVEDKEVVHGFVKGRNVVTNALPHVGKKVTISFDIKDFFDTVTFDKAKEFLPNIILSDEKLIRLCFPNGYTAQGLPTSPAIANLVAQRVDRKVKDIMESIGVPYVYTRYADDLSISIDDENPDTIRKIIKLVKEVIPEVGFQINTNKVNVQKAKNGRREICGVMVGDEGIYISRKKRRLISALYHYLNKIEDGVEEIERAKAKKKIVKKIERRIEGLHSFALLKVPKEAKYEYKYVKNISSQRM